MRFLKYAFAYNGTGSARAIVPTREMILECLQLSRPTCILSVPVLFNRVRIPRDVFIGVVGVNDRTWIHATEYGFVFHFR